MAVPVIIKLQVEGGKVVQGELRGIGDAADGSFRKVEAGSRAATQSLRQTEVATGGLRSAMSALASVATVAVAVDLGRRVIEVGDAYQSLRDRIALAAGGIEQGAEAQRRIFQISQETRQPLQDVSDLYAKVGARATEMGLSMDDQATVIRMVGQALALNKTSAQAASEGIRQFGQMFGGAKVQAEEFNSIIDSMPPLADAMAKGLLGASATVGDLKARLEDGLAPETAIRALLTQADDLDQKFGQIGKTVTDVSTQISNQLFETTGSIMSSSGATNELVGGMERLLAAVSDPQFGEGLRWIVGQFVEMFGDVAKGIGDSVGQIEDWKKTIASVSESAGGTPQTFREAHPIISGIFDGWAEKAGLLQTLVLQMNRQMSTSFRETAAEMSALYQQAISGQQQLANFAGGNNFRAAQDAGTENEASRAAVAMQNAAFSNPQPPTPIPSPFTPVARPQDKADAAYAAAADRAAAAAERALSEAQKIFARDEAAINEMLRQTYAAVDERGKFISSAMGKLSESANDNQIAAMEKAAGAAYQKAEMDKYAADQVARKQQIEQAGIATTNEFATATEIFAARMLDLRTQLEAGAISQETYRRAAKAASDEAVEAERRIREERDKGLKKGEKDYEDSYAKIGRTVDRTYQGISAGLAAMIMKNEFEIGTFVEGIAQQLLQSGLQSLLAGGIGGGMQGGGILGMLGIGPATPAPSAHGNVFAGGNIIPFARGGIVDRPVVFPMAEGAGLMGEAGPEAVMPLRRLPSGDLGVAAGGGSSPQITITLVNESRTQLRAEQQAGPDGNLKVMLREIIGAEIGTPGTPGHMATRGVVQRYGSGR